MKEIWKDIKGYEGLYQVSNLGNVKRLKFINGKHNFDKIRECKKTLNTYGYLTVNLSKNGKVNTKRVHRLVAVAFLGINNLQIDHIDGNKQNNHLSNLEYVTAKENTNRAWKKGLCKPGEKSRKVLVKYLDEKWKNHVKRTKEEKNAYQREYYKNNKEKYNKRAI